MSNEYAFPSNEMDQSEPERVYAFRTGMTLRDYFASHADVEVYLPVETFEDYYGRKPSIGELAEHIAKIRFAEADAMLKAREVSDAE